MDETNIKFDLVPGSKTVYFLFGGISGQLAMPPFEFYKAASILSEHKIFLRDVKQCWYQCGIDGAGSDIYQLADFMRVQMKTLGVSEACFVGNSMGGFAAILFASILGGRAIAFAPQTFISPMKRLLRLDRRWSAQILKMYLTSPPQHVYDLWPIVTNGLGQIDIYVGDDRLDRVHGHALAGIKNVAIHEYDVGGHNLVKHLRDCGQLAGILTSRSLPLPSA